MRNHFLGDKKLLSAPRGHASGELAKSLLPARWGEASQTPQAALLSGIWHVAAALTSTSVTKVVKLLHRAALKSEVLSVGLVHILQDVGMGMMEAGVHILTL